MVSQEMLERELGMNAQEIHEALMQLDELTSSSSTTPPSTTPRPHVDNNAIPTIPIENFFDLFQERSTSTNRR